MKQALISGVLVLVCGLALAKLPPPTDAAKAKAAEAAAKAAWQAKVDAYQLCKVQDKVAAQYKKAAGSAAGKAASAASMPAPAASHAASGTPVAAAPPQPCQEPGPFAYNPPEQKPPATPGAHSPPGTAASPPGAKDHSSAMAPAKKP